MSPDQKLHSLAAGRYGVFSRDEALERGMSSSAIDRRIASCRWLVVHRGVYRLAGTPDTWESRVMAALLWFGEGSLASHRCAAAILELDGVLPGVIELTVPVGRSSPPGMHVHRIRSLPTSTRRIKGFRITNVERTLLDLCAVLPPRACGRAIDDALRRRLTTLHRLWEMCDTAKRRTGCRLFRQLLELRDDRDGTVASRMETRLLRILKRIKEHEVLPQCKVSAGEQRYYIDFGYLNLMVGIEGHSVRWHLGEDAFKADVRRDRRLTLAGWTILYFCWDDIVFDPEGVERDVRTALQQRAVLFATGFRG